MVFRTAICLLGLLSTSHFLRATEYVIPQSEFFGTNDHLSVIQEALDNYDVVVLSDYANMAAPNSPDNSGLWSVWRVGNPVIISGGKTLKLNKNVCLAAKKIGKFNEFNKRVGVVEFRGGGGSLLGEEGPAGTNLFGTYAGKPYITYYRFEDFTQNYSANKSGVLLERAVGADNIDYAIIEYADIRNPVIKGLDFIKCMGDGIYVRGRREGNVFNLTIDQVTSYQCARSGLVIDGVTRASVTNSIFEESGLANGELIFQGHGYINDGIHFEPPSSNADLELFVVKNVEIHNVKCLNNKRFQLFANLHSATDYPANHSFGFVVDDCNFIGGKKGIFLRSLRNQTEDLNGGPSSGALIVKNSYIARSETEGIHVSAWLAFKLDENGNRYEEKPLIRFEDVTVYDTNLNVLADPSLIPVTAPIKISHGVTTQIEVEGEDPILVFEPGPMGNVQLMDVCVIGNNTGNALVYRGDEDNYLRHCFGAIFVGPSAPDSILTSAPGTFEHAILVIQSSDPLGECDE